MKREGTASRDLAWGRLATTADESTTGIGEGSASVIVAAECVARHKEQCVADSFAPPWGASSL
jgi:hypothetical protein